MVLPVYVYLLFWQNFHVGLATSAGVIIMAILLVVAVFAFVQRWLIEGLLAGAVKG